MPELYRSKTHFRIAEARMYTLREAALFFGGRSIRWVRDRVKSGELDGFATGMVVVSGQSMNRYLRERQL